MQKKHNAIALVLILMFFVAGVGVSFAAWDGSSSEKPETEKIDNKDFFLIKTEANLAWFRDSVNAVKGNSTINAKLMASLDMEANYLCPLLLALVK